MVVNSLNGTTEAGISEADVVDEGVRPVLGSRVVHDLLKAGVDNVDLTGSTEFSHVRRALGNDVAHHGEDLLVLPRLVFLGHAAGGNVSKILEPLEVGASDTTSVSEHVGDDNNTLGVENLFSHEGSGSVSSLKHNLALEIMGVFDVDSLLLSAGNKDVALLFHEGSGVNGLNLLSVAVVSKSALAKHLSSNIIDIESGRVVDSRVVFNNSDNETAIFLDEFGSPVSDGTEALDNESLARDSLSSEFSGLDEGVGLHELSDAVVDTKSSTFLASGNTTLVDELSSAAAFSVDVIFSLQLNVSIFNPGHDLLVCAHVGSEAVDTRTNKALLSELHSVSSGDLLELTLRVVFGINSDTSLSSSEWNIGY